MNVWVLLDEAIQELPPKKTYRTPIFENFCSLSKEKMQTEKRKHNK